MANLVLSCCDAFRVFHDLPRTRLAEGGWHPRLSPTPERSCLNTFLSDSAPKRQAVTGAISPGECKRGVCMLFLLVSVSCANNPTFSACVLATWWHAMIAPQSFPEDRCIHLRIGRLPYNPWTNSMIHKQTSNLDLINGKFGSVMLWCLSCVPWSSPDQASGTWLTPKALKQRSYIIVTSFQTSIFEGYIK